MRERGACCCLTRLQNLKSRLMLITHLSSPNNSVIVLYSNLKFPKPKPITYMKKKITKHMSKSIASLLLVLSVCWIARADYLPNNFWPNPGFELGVNLDQTNGVPTDWTAGGGDPTMCQVTTNN